MCYKSHIMHTLLSKVLFKEKIKILIISPITLAYLIVSYEFPSEAIAFAKWKAMLVLLPLVIECPISPLPYKLQPF